MPNQTTADSVREEWGNILRLERHRRRLNQAKVAELAGLAGPTIAKLEAGRGSLDTFLKVAEALDVDLLGEAE